MSDYEIIYYCLIAGILGGISGCTFYGLIKFAIDEILKKRTTDTVRRTTTDLDSARSLNQIRPAPRVVRRTDDVLWLEEQQKLGKKEKIPNE